MMVTMKYRGQHLRGALVVAALLVSAGGSGGVRAEPPPVGLLRASVARQAPRVLTEPEVGDGVSVRLRQMHERREAYQARRRNAAGGAASGGHSATKEPASLPRQPLPLPPNLLEGVNH